MINRLLFVLLLIIGSNLYAQTSDCKVNNSSISGSYTGGCKNGLASGKGVAQGIDRYEGQFEKGLPSGRGTYKWANGIYYEGQWKNGMREGEGKMVYPDSLISGFWKEDKYVGKKKLVPYEIISISSIARYTITKNADRNNTVKFRIKQGGLDNISIENFSMFFDSGSEYRSGNIYGIENISYPVIIKIKYRTWNQLMTAQSDVRFEIEIKEPGSWDIILFN
jgi:hypothetical protein